VWQIVVELGAEVAVGDRMVVLESMKMEIAIVAPVAGTVIEVLCTQGQMVSVGQALLSFNPEPFRWRHQIILMHTPAYSNANLASYLITLVQRTDASRLLRLLKVIGSR
jgi:hypothetical protein